MKTTNNNEAGSDKVKAASDKKNTKNASNSSDASLPESQAKQEILSLVASLAKIINDKNLTEIEVNEGDIKVRVSSAKESTTATQFVNIPSSPTNMIAPSNNQQQSENIADINSFASQDIGEKIKSPMVGTIYLAPAPGAANFISVGQEVEKGKTLIIIEAMKTMNHIPSPKNGKIVEICVNDSDPVQFGDVICVID